jgi:iron complex transport system substrate-binding protein
MLKLIHVAAALLVALLATPSLAHSFPVTIKHALGETVIPAAPKRIVTLGWSSTDAAIALGTVPVGFPSFRSAGFDKDIVPWVEEWDRRGGRRDTRDFRRYGGGADREDRGAEA